MNYRNVNNKPTITITKDDVIQADLITSNESKYIVIGSPLTLSEDVTIEKKILYKDEDQDPIIKFNKYLKNIHDINLKINKLEDLVQTLNKTKITKLERYVDDLIKSQLQPEFIKKLKDLVIKPVFDNSKLIDTPFYYNEPLEIIKIDSKTPITNLSNRIYRPGYIIYNIVAHIESKKKGGTYYTNIKFYFDSDSDKPSKKFSIISKEVAPDNYFNCTLEYTKDKILKFNCSTDFDHMTVYLFKNI